MGTHGRDSSHPGKQRAAGRAHSRDNGSSGTDGGHSGALALHQGVRPHVGRPLHPPGSLGRRA